MEEGDQWADFRRLLLKADTRGCQDDAKDEQSYSRPGIRKGREQSLHILDASLKVLVASITLVSGNVVNPSFGLDPDHTALQPQDHRVRAVFGIEFGENAFDVCLRGLFVDS